MIDVRVLRAAGLSDSQIVSVIEVEQAAEAEKKAERQETRRQDQRRYRERLSSKNSSRVTAVTVTPPTPTIHPKNLNEINGHVTPVTVTQATDNHISILDKSIIINNNNSGLDVTQAEQACGNLVEFGKSVANTLRSLPPQSDNAKVLHDAAEMVLTAHGFVVKREFSISFADGVAGFIDLVVLGPAGERVAIELDRRLPRANSLKKLMAFDGYRIVVTRSKEPCSAFEGVVNDVIAVPPVTNESFEEFWQVYPRRKGSNPKEPARLRFERVIREGVDSLALIAGARAYATAESANVGTPYIAQAVTWLNQRRWEDYKPEASRFTPEELARGREWYARKQAQANGGGS